MKILFENQLLSFIGFNFQRIFCLWAALGILLTYSEGGFITTLVGYTHRAGTCFVGINVVIYDTIG